MSLPPTNQNVSNGMLPHQWASMKPMPANQQAVSPQIYPAASINGIQNSAHSSRDPSPHAGKYQPTVLNQIPASQLPPGMKPGNLPQRQGGNILLSQVQDTPKNILLAPMNMNMTAPSLLTGPQSAAPVQLVSAAPRVSSNVSPVVSVATRMADHQIPQRMNVPVATNANINKINSEPLDVINRAQNSNLVNSGSGTVIPPSLLQSNNIEPVARQMKSLDVNDFSPIQKQSDTNRTDANQKVISSTTSQIDSHKLFNSGGAFKTPPNNGHFSAPQETVPMPPVSNLMTVNLHENGPPQDNRSTNVPNYYVPSANISNVTRSSTTVSSVFHSVPASISASNMKPLPQPEATATPPPNIQWFPQPNISEHQQNVPQSQSSVSQARPNIPQSHQNVSQAQSIQPNHHSMQNRPNIISSEAQQYPGIRNVDRQVAPMPNLNQAQSASVPNLNQPPSYSKSNQQFVSNVPNQITHIVRDQTVVNQKKMDQAFNINQLPASQPAGPPLNLNSQVRFPGPPPLNNQQPGLPMNGSPRQQSNLNQPPPPPLYNQPVQKLQAQPNPNQLNPYVNKPPMGPVSNYQQPAVQPPPIYPNAPNVPPMNQFSAANNSPIGKRYPAKPAYQNQPQGAPQPYQQPNQEMYAQQNQQQPNYNQYGQQLNVTQTGFNRLWGHENVDLLQHRNILPAEKVEAPAICLVQECLNAANCSPDIFRCTMTKIPESSSLLNKSRLPLGVLIHPFRDLNHLPVIQCSTIVRCRTCRTYINPFVYFVDTKRWKCNLCYRVNELPEEFQYDPVSKSYGDPSRRPEIKSSTIEYIAPSEYMLRPPQPAIYLFIMDVSAFAVESGYLEILCNTLIEELDNLPGDTRTQVGFMCYNSALHFYSLAEGLSQPHEMTVVDIDDVFLPCPDNLLVNLKERKELIKDLLSQLPTRFMNSHDNGSALGAALQAAFKMISPTGGRVTVFQCTLPTVGPGALSSREVPSQRNNTEVAHLNPATDFYKRLALECSANQVAVDLFILNSQYIDLSTISGISRFSAGCMYHWPLFKKTRTTEAQQFYNCLRRYLTRKIGYEAVMRIRCTRGLSIHTFHGNFFVRSIDLLSLPNCNPDSGFGMQVSIEENLSDLQNVCFQAALLYTSSKGERRIRVHTLCLPVVATLSEVLNSADQQCIVGILSKMAVDRSFQSSLTDARDAFINAVIDILSAYKLSLNQGSGVGTGLLAPNSLRLLPLYIVALLKYTAFRTGTSTRLDDRVFAMCEMKTLPLTQLIQHIYPDLYPIHCLSDDGGIPTEEGRIIPQPPRIQLSAEKLDSRGAFLLDSGSRMMIYVGHSVAIEFLNTSLGYPHFEAIPDECYELPKTGTPANERLHIFISSLNDEKSYPASLQIIRDDSPFRNQFAEKLIEDRVENALSYYEFLQHLKTHVK